MKFFSYTNRNNNYTMAISLENVRSVQTLDGTGKSVIRFGVRVNYINGTHESLFWLESDEAKKVFKEIVDLLNKGA
jgi:hypothetical protein